MPILEHTGHPGFAVEAGELISVLGAPGSGKSRLGLELAFLARPQNGEVLFRGKSWLKPQRSLRSQPRPREVTMLVQNAEEQLFARTVFDDVAFGPRHLLLEDAEIERRVLTALSAVRLDPEQIQNRSPFALSGGERRRVALAGVLAMEPEVLILDEPTSNLDPRTRDEFLDLLDPLRGRSAIVWMTVVAAEATRVGQVYVLQDGQLTDAGNGTIVLRDWRRLAAAGVELPCLYELAAAVEQRGCPLPGAATPDELEEAMVQTWRSGHHAG